VYPVPARTVNEVDKILAVGPLVLGLSDVCVAGRQQNPARPSCLPFREGGAAGI